MDSGIKQVRDTRGRLAFWSLMVAIAALLLLYAVTRAFVWDEGYHLMAAQHIAHGKLPYIDFCFPQTPLNAYVNAGIIMLFGEHWRPIHVVAGLFCLGAMILVAQYFWKYFPAENWRLPCALTAAVFIGFNTVVDEFGPIGQAYGICLFFTVAAYRMSIKTPASGNVFWPFLSGVFAGIAAGSSLLTAPVAPVLLIWVWVYHQTGLRWLKSAAFITGGCVPFLPLLWLYFQGKEQTVFNIVKYHALYRASDWPGADYHNLQVFMSWLSSTQALTLVLLSIAGVLFLIKRCEWSRPQRAEFYLAGWLSLAEGAYLSTPFPTFGRYFIFLVPFMTILSMPGLYALGEKMGYTQRPAWPTGIVAVLVTLMCVPFVVDSFQQTTWQDYEKVAQKVAEVTPKGGRIFADELVYFILGQAPPSGMEVSYTHTVKLSPAEEKLEHIVSVDELKKQFVNHDFVTAQSCTDAEMERYGLADAYPNRKDMDDCSIFWVGQAK
jgi:hypothetical protein